MCVSFFLPGLFLQDEMRLHEELDAQPQPARRHAVHLLADAVPQIEPQVLALAAGELQAQVVHLNDAQLPADLQGGAAESNSRSLHTRLEVVVVVVGGNKEVADT